MSAVADLAAETAKMVASVNAAITALGAAPDDAAQLAAVTAQLATAQAALDAAVAAKSPPAITPAST